MKRRATENAHYDVIIVGSGIGGLGIGLYLQSKNPDLKTIILEQHHEPGGFVSGFKRKGFYFDSGAEGVIHFGKGGIIREIIEELGFHHEYIRIDPIEVFHFRDKTIIMHADVNQFIDELAKYYPDQKEGVIAFIDVCKAITREISKADLLSSQSSFLAMLKAIVACPNLRKFGRLGFSDLIDRFITNDEVKEFFYIFCLWMGLTPEQLPAPLGAFLLVSTNVNGLYYPRGGMLATTRKVAELYESRGGTIKYRSKVQKILIEGKKAVGVKTEDGTIIHGDWIVSNADLKQTVFDLVGKKYFKRGYLKHIQSLKQSVSGFSVFLGVDMDLSEYAPHISFSPYIENIRRVQNGEFQLNELRIRILSNVDPSLNKCGRSSVRLFNFAPYQWKDYWQSGPNRKRIKAYYQLKEEYTEKMIALAEKVIPELSEHIVVKEIATPLTYERDNLVTNGAWYGPRMDQKLPNHKSPIKKLLFAGSNVGGSGVPSALLSCLETAKYILKKHKK